MKRYLKRIMTGVILCMLMYFALPVYAANAAGVDMIVDDYLTLSNDRDVSGNLYLWEPLDLNGHVLRVSGNVYAESSLFVGDGTLIVSGNYVQKIGVLDISAGKATIGGDLRFQTVDALGEYTTGSGDLEIGDGSLTVNQSLILDTTASMVYYVDGTITVKGDMIDKNSNDFSPNSLVLAGEGKQRLELNKSTFVDNLTLTNPNVEIAGYLNGYLKSNANEITLDDGLFQTTYLNLNGNSMVIPGDVEATGDVFVGSGILTVTGDYMQKTGLLSIGAGKATIGGDLRFQTVDALGEYTTGSGDLEIGDGSLTVNQSLILDTTASMVYYVNGTIIVKGDVIDKNSNDFNPSKLVLAGAGKQRLELTSSTFLNDLTLTNPNVEIAGYLNGYLKSNANEITLDDGLFQTTYLNLNGNSMVIPGDVEATGDVFVGSGLLTVTGDYMQKTSLLSIGAGKATIGGDLRFQTVDALGEYTTGIGDLEIGDGSLTVNQSLILDTTASMVYYVNGTIIVKGDVIDKNSNDFNPSKLVLAGAGKQRLELTSSTFLNDLTLTNPNVEIAGYLNGYLKSNANEITLDDGLFQTTYLNLNGNSMVIPGDVEATGDVFVGSGLLTVTGDYMQKTSLLSIGAGKATIGGDLRFQTVDALGEYTTGSGDLEIGDGSLTVNQSLILDTTADMGSYVNGIIAVKGDVIQENAFNFNPNKLVLSGEDKQRLELMTEAFLDNLVLTNPNVEIAGYLNGHLKSNANEITLDDGKFQTTYLKLNGNSMVIPGDVEVTGDMFVGAGSLTVTGDYMQKTGLLSIGAGNATIGGDLRFQTVDSLGAYATGSGDLEIGDGSLTVNQSLILDTTADMGSYVNGIITVKGDVIQENAFNFNPNKLVLSGEDKQRLELMTEAFLDNLVLTNPNVEIAGYLNGHLKSNANEITLDDGKFQTTYLKLNGNSMVIPGDVEVTGDMFVGAGSLTVTGDYMQKTGLLSIGAGNATIGGDLRFQTVDSSGAYATGSGDLEIGDGSLTVNQSLILDTTADMYYYVSGIITVNGDLLQEHDAAFKPSYVIMDGEGAQKIQLGANGWINTLELKQKTKYYTFEPDPCYNTLIEKKTPVTSIKLNETAVTLEQEDIFTLIATVLPEDADVLTVSWSSDNEKVATVNEHGAVRAISAGTATITVSAMDTSGVTATCVVTVNPDADAIVEFVNRMYRIILEREPDAGSETWINGLRDGSFTGVRVADGFVLSEEMLNKDISNQEFVKILYRAFFGREADVNGLKTWTDLLDSGCKKTYVFAGFANSTEFGTLCTNAGIVQGRAVEYLADRQTGLSEKDYKVWCFVERMYTEVLQRTADESGVRTWVGVLQDGSYTGVQVAEGFLMSDEFLAKNMNNEEYIKILYRAFFGRDADQGGLATWTNAMADGWTKKRVFAGFANSNEFGTLCDQAGIVQGTAPEK